MAEETVKKPRKPRTKKQLEHDKKMPEINEETRFTSGLQAVQNGRKGGKKSQEIQHQRRKWAEDAVIILNKALKSGKVMDINDIESLAKEELNDANLPLQQLMMITMAQSVLKEHNTKAWEDFIKLTGETLDRHEINATIEEKPNKKRTLEIVRQYREQMEKKSE